MQQSLRHSCRHKLQEGARLSQTGLSSSMQGTAASQECKAQMPPQVHPLSCHRPCEVLLLSLQRLKSTAQGATASLNRHLKAQSRLPVQGRDPFWAQQASSCPAGERARSWLCPL